MSISDYGIQDQIDLQNAVFDLRAVLKTYRDRLPVGDILLGENLGIQDRWTGSELYIYGCAGVYTVAELMYECELKLAEYDGADTVRALEYTSAAARKVLTNMVDALNKVWGEKND